MKIATTIGVLLAAAAACNEPPRGAGDGVLVISESVQTSAFVRNFNPLLEVGDVRWPARHAMYEPLLIHEPLRGDYVPWLAASWAWTERGVALRFDLRHGVRWSDGAKLTAADVAFTFELLARHPALDLRGVWQFLDEVRAVDAHTVTMRFSRPFVPGLYAVAQQPIVPAHVWRDVADPVSFANEHPVASGPFTEITQFQAQAYQVDRNPYYWQAGKPAVRALRFLALPSNEQSNLALLRGEIDWAGDFVPAVERIFVARDPEHHRFWFPLIDGTVMFYANTTRAPFHDVRVRKALSMAIDRDRLVAVAMQNYSRPAHVTGLSDAHARWRDADAAWRLDWTALDVAGAGRLLDEAGLVRDGDGHRRPSDGARWSPELIVPVGFSDWVRGALVIRRGLAAAGIDVRVRAIDFNAWYERVQVGDFDLAMGWSEVGPTPYHFYRGLMGSATVRPTGEPAAENWHRLGIPAADALLAAVEREPDPAAEDSLYRQLAALFVEHAPAIPLFPGPLWGECSTRRFTGFPDEHNPYAPLSPHWAPQTLLVLVELQPRREPRRRRCRAPGARRSRATRRAEPRRAAVPQ